MINLKSKSLTIHDSIWLYILSCLDNINIFEQRNLFATSWTRLITNHIWLDDYKKLFTESRYTLSLASNSYLLHFIFISVYVVKSVISFKLFVDKVLRKTFEYNLPLIAMLFTPCLYCIISFVENKTIVSHIL